MRWLIVGGIVAFIVWAWRRGTRAAPNRIESPDHVMNALQFLLRRGIHGGLARFQVDDDALRAVVFTKYIVAPGDVGLRASCTQGSQSAERFASFRQELVDRKIPHDYKNSGAGSTLEVQTGSDLGAGVMFVVLAFQRLFEVKLADHCVAYFEDVLNADAPNLTGVEA